MRDEENLEVQETAYAAKGNKAEGGIDAGIGKYKVHVAEQQLPLVGMFFTAIVLLIAVTTGGRSSGAYFGYAVSVPALAMVFSFVGLLLTMKEDLNAKVGRYNSQFLFLWCFVGACFLTFRGPFLLTGNGYFASWAMAIFSIMAVGISGESVQSAVSGIGSLLGLLASAIVLIIAIPSVKSLGSSYRSESIFGLVVACFTIPVVCFFIYSERDGSDPSKVKVPVLFFFAILWVVLACFLTFSGPFLYTNNGYFASWGGAAASLFAAMTALRKE